MLEVVGKHTHLFEYFGTVEDPSGQCLLSELCLSKVSITRCTRITRRLS